MEGELEPEMAPRATSRSCATAFGLEGAETPRFDLIQLGLGTNGHTASLFPHTPALHEFGRLVVANLTDAAQPWRLTLTAPVLNQGADVFFLIGGADKAQVVKDVFLGPRNPEELPAQIDSTGGRYTYFASGQGRGGATASAQCGRPRRTGMRLGSKGAREQGSEKAAENERVRRHEDPSVTSALSLAEPCSPLLRGNE